MPDSFADWIDAVQLLVNVGALIGGAVVWRLYVENLRAQIGVKDATITNVEKNRDFWRDKAQELEKRSPEFMEQILTSGSAPARPRSKGWRRTARRTRSPSGFSTRRK